MKICWILAEYDYHPLDTPIFATSFQYPLLHKNGWLFDFCFELAVVSFSTFLDTCSFLYLRVRFYPLTLPLLLLKCMLINGMHWLQIQTWHCCKSPFVLLALGDEDDYSNTDFLFKTSDIYRQYHVWEKTYSSTRYWLQDSLLWGFYPVCKKGATTKSPRIQHIK